MWKCKFKETIKTKGSKEETDRTGRKRGLNNSQKNSETTKRAPARVVTRNLRRSTGDDNPRSRNNSGEIECPRKRKKKLIYSPEDTSRKSLVPSRKPAPKRKVSDGVQKKQKRKRIILESDNESDHKTEASKTEVNKHDSEPRTDYPEPANESSCCDSDNSSERQLNSSSTETSGRKTLIHNQLLLRKLKREINIQRPTQKYETERTDYIKEEKPSHLDHKTIEYVCHETLTSRESSPKPEGEKSQRICDNDDDEARAESQASSSSGGGRSGRSRSDLGHRTYINFQVGGRLEARDYLNMWYPSRIIQVDWDHREILIHFERWNSRFDEWVAMDSPRLRPITRTSTRKDSKLKKIPTPKEFRIGEVVYAKWSDCKMYPAKLLRVNPDETYTVQFYDGFERDVQFINVKKLPPELVGKVHFKPEAIAKIQEEKTRRLSGSKSSESSSAVDQGSSAAVEKSILEPQPKVKDGSRDGVGLSSSKVTSGITPNKRNKLLVGGIFQAKRQQLKVKIGGGALTKMRKQSIEKSSSGRNSPQVAAISEGNLKDTSSTEDKPKLRGSVSTPLLIQELSKAPLNESPVSVGVPSKAFRIEEDHNHFKCTVPGCGKSFRKDVLLASHMKHYHSTPKTVASVRKSVSGSEVKEEAVENKGSMSENIPEITGNENATLPAATEGNKERKLITVKRRQLLMQRKLENQSKTKDQHISDVIASVAKKFNQTPMEKTATVELSVKEAPPRPEKARSSPKKRRFFFSTKVMSRLRRMKMMSSAQTGKITNGRRISPLEDGPQEELINCSCERAEEDGLMMQCEVCLAWQHGSCFGIEDEQKVPEKYICHVCKNPKGLRRSYRYCYNQDWFKTGELASFKSIPKRDNWHLRNNVYKTHGLAAHALFVKDGLQSLRCKLEMAKTSSHADLKRWARPWPRRSSKNGTDVNETDKTGDELWGFSDHCYSVPNQEYTNDSLVDQNGLFFNEGSKGLFEVAANEVLDMDGAASSDETNVSDTQKKTEPGAESSASSEEKAGSANSVPINVVTSNDSDVKSKDCESDLKSELPSSNITRDISSENLSKSPNSEKAVVEGAKLPDSFENDAIRWQLNLLDHIENEQLELEARLDKISKKIEVLEAEYEYTDASISKDPTTEVTRTRRLLSCLINDLAKVHRLSLYR